MTAIYLLLALASVVCAVQAIRASRLLHSSLWLAALSACVSLWLYVLGAREIAVIELSVGAGLVTVLLAFVIGIAGDEPPQERSLIPTPLALALVCACLVLVGAFVLPGEAIVVRTEPSLTVVLWQGRSLDLLAQLVLLFAGVLGVRTLLQEAEARFAMPDLRLRLLRKTESEPAALQAGDEAGGEPVANKAVQ